MTVTNLGDRRPALRKQRKEWVSSSCPIGKLSCSSGSWCAVYSMTFRFYVAKSRASSRARLGFCCFVSVKYSDACIGSLLYSLSIVGPLLGGRCSQIAACPMGWNQLEHCRSHRRSPAAERRCLLGQGGRIVFLKSFCLRNMIIPSSSMANQELS